MVIIIAQHKTQKDASGNPLRQEFEEVQWLTKWQQTGEWLQVGRKESASIEEPAVQAKTITVKKGCGRCGTKK